MTASVDNAPQPNLPDKAMAGEEARLLLEEIWRVRSRRLLSMTRRITGNREDAEDALQDTFLRAFMHIRDFDRRSTLSTWLTRIAINSSLMIVRKRRKTATVSLENDGVDGGVQPIASLRDPGPAPEELTLRGEGARRLRARVCRLPVLLREPVQLHALEERSVEETARLCGISVTATKARLFRARASLYSSLQSSLAPGDREPRRQPLAS